MCFQELLLPFLPQDVVHVSDDLPISTSLERKHLSSVIVPCEGLSLKCKRVHESLNLGRYRLCIRLLDDMRLSMLPRSALR